MYNQNTKTFGFDRRKALEVLLFLASNGVDDMYHLLKAYYFADKKFLQRYGRFICGGHYVAMKHGPVPSQVYDMVKIVRGDGLSIGDTTELKTSFKINENTIIPLRRPSFDSIAEAELEVLREVIKEIKNLNFDDLHKRSADSAYENVSANDEMSVFDIAKTLENSDEIIDYLQSKYN